jgi:kinetochore protein Spc24
MSSSRPSTVPSAEGHVKIVNDLDKTKLSLAKAINGAESSLASKESELTKLKDEFKELEQHDVAKQAGNELDGST